jgi:uncharacterized protein YraI
MKARVLKTAWIALALVTAFAQPAFARASELASPARTVVAAESEVTVTVDSLNVRAGPGLDQTIIGKLSGGSKVTPTGKSDDGQWWKIDYNGTTAYIYAAYAVAGGTYGAAAASGGTAASGTAAVTSDFLNVRAGPGLDQTIISKLDGGATVQVLGRSADGAWLKISFNGGEAYVYAAYTTAGAGTGTAAAAAPAAAAAAPARSAGGFELGGHIRSTDFLNQMKDIGMTWVKYQVVMDGGAPDLSGQISTIHGAGMKILIGAVGNRSRAADTGYHGEFAGYLASLASQGADAIEVWNEPNLDREYGGSGNGQVNPENYVDMLAKAYAAIKAANGGTLVIGGANAPTGYFGGNCTAGGCNDDQFLARMAAAGAANYMDCMGAHHNGSMVGPDQTNGAPTGDHYSWYFWGTFGVTYNAFGGKVPLCWTELGYVTGEGIGALPGGFSWGSSTTLDNQAQWLARAAQLSRESGKVRLMIIWNMDFRQWDEDPQAGFSIFRPNGECRACATIKAAMGR